MSAEPTRPPGRPVSGQELFELGTTVPCELIDGRVVEMSPTGGEHGYVETEISGELRQFVRQRRLGWVLCGEVGIYISHNPDRVRAADVALFTHQQLPQGLPKGYIDVAPTLAVEIISPHDRWEDVRAKLGDYFSIGVEQVWVVEPTNRTVLVYRSETNVTHKLSVGDTLRGEGALTGFELPLAQLFESAGPHS